MSKDDDILYLDVDEVLGGMANNVVIDDSNKSIPSDQLISNQLYNTTNKLKMLTGTSDDTKKEIKVNDITSSKQPDVVESSKSHIRRNVIGDRD